MKPRGDTHGGLGWVLGLLELGTGFGMELAGGWFRSERRESMDSDRQYRCWCWCW